MKVSILVALIVTSALCALVGVLSIYRPKIIGTEFVWSKTNKVYVLKSVEPTNDYYLRYIKIMGVGFILSALALLAVSVMYVFNPALLDMK